MFLSKIFSSFFSPFWFVHFDFCKLDLEDHFHLGVFFLVFFFFSNFHFQGRWEFQDRTKMNSQTQVENEINLPRKKTIIDATWSQFLIMISFDMDIPILQNIFDYLAWETHLWLPITSFDKIKIHPLDMIWTKCAFLSWMYFFKN